MNLRRTNLAMRFESSRVNVARVGLAGPGDTRVHEAASIVIPDAIDRKNHEAFGRWLAGELSERGIGKVPVVLAVGRGEVVLKRLTLPRGKGVTEHDLPAMVRLQMARQVTFPLDASGLRPEGVASVDFVRLDDPESEDETQVSILAGALPGDRVSWIQGVLRSAGLKLERVALISSGLAERVRGAAARHSGPVLGIGLSRDGAEFVVVEDGRLAFARAADASLESLGLDAFAGRVGIEAKRTWMTFRVGRDAGGEIEAAYVVGSGELADRVARSCGTSLDMPSSTLASLFPVGDSLAEPDRLSLDPVLAAVDLEGDFDFAHPRRGPDFGARRRQRALAGVLGAIVVVGGGLVWARMDLASLTDDAGAAEARAGGLQADYLAHEREHARLMHLRQWRESSIDWLSHLTYLSEQMPDAKLALLDEVRGNSNESSVAFSPREGRYDGGKWTGRPRASMTLVGSVKARATANELRGRLLVEAGYGVTSTGPDVENRFVFAVTSDRVHAGRADAEGVGESRPAEGTP